MKQLKHFKIKPLPTQCLQRGNKTVLQVLAKDSPRKAHPLGKVKDVELSPRKRINQGQLGAFILSSVQE